MDGRVTDFAGTGALEAMANSYSFLTRGLQQIARESADYSKTSFEDGVAHLQTLSGTRSPQAAIALQTSFVTAACEAYIAQARRIGTLMTDLARDGSRPFEAEVTRAMQNAGQGAGATPGATAAAA